MGRYRPPPAPKSPYITPEGAQRLRDELKYLWREKRPEVTRAVSEAAALGDRSENAEYIYGKKMLREIDRRVRYLSKRLDEVQVVDQVPDDTSRVFFGAWVDVLDEDGGPGRYRIVGPDEYDPSRGFISIDSPLARALIGKSAGDEIVIMAAGNEQHYEISAVSYQESK